MIINSHSSHPIESISTLTPNEEGMYFRERVEFNRDNTIFVAELNIYEGAYNNEITVEFVEELLGLSGNFVTMPLPVLIKLLERLAIYLEDAKLKKENVL